MKSRRFFEDGKKVDARSCYTLLEKVSGGRKRCQLSPHTKDGRKRKQRTPLAPRVLFCGMSPVSGGVFC